MKLLLTLAVLGFGGWWLYKKFHTPENVKKVQEVQDAPVKYVSALQADVKRAEDVANKANARIKETGQDVQRGIEDAEKK